MNLVLLYVDAAGQPVVTSFADLPRGADERAFIQGRVSRIVPEEFWSTVRIVDKANAEKAIARSLFATNVKAECRRRILLVISEDQQRNSQTARMEAQEAYGLDRAAWPEQALAASRVEGWAEIERLRARSNEIERMEPLPDLADDTLWRHRLGGVSDARAPKSLQGQISTEPHKRIKQSR